MPNTMDIENSSNFARLRRLSRHAMRKNQLGVGPLELMESRAGISGGGSFLHHAPTLESQHALRARRQFEIVGDQHERGIEFVIHLED